MLITLISLALVQWDKSFSTGVFAIIGTIGGVGVAGHAGLHLKLVDVLEKVWDAFCWVVKVKEAVDEEEAKEEQAQGAEEEEEEAKVPIGDENV